MRAKRKQVSVVGVSGRALSLVICCVDVQAGLQWTSHPYSLLVGCPWRDSVCFVGRIGGGGGGETLSSAGTRANPIDVH